MMDTRLRLLEDFGLLPSVQTTARAGDRFGEYTVLAVGKRPGSRRAHAVVQCSCGSAPRVTRVDGMKVGSITSCGCVHKARVTKHGLWSHPLYDVWRNMMKRCYDPRQDRYPQYGGRGITVCEAWHDVRGFVRDMEADYEPGLELDRIDNDLGYSPTNCRWLDHIGQARNRRNVYRITIDGVTKTAFEWAREHGVNYGTALSRIKAGWDQQAAVTAQYDARRSPKS